MSESVPCRACVMCVGHRNSHTPRCALSNEFVTAWHPGCGNGLAALPMVWNASTRKYENPNPSPKNAARAAIAKAKT